VVAVVEVVLLVDPEAQVAGVMVPIQVLRPVLALLD
tara:strand:- start:642 stop:749 length:108 start_codon:yes stop_codon:yes gene_type:complete